MHTLVIASQNQKKTAELQSILGAHHITCQPLSDYTTHSPAETGATFVENALIKARAACAATQLPALADDSGLVVPALQGAPGLYSARYAGAAASDAENRAKLLQDMAELNDSARQAYFICVLAVLRHDADPDPLIVQGRWMGQIHTTEDGDGGFGYDAIFWVPTAQCTAATLSPEQKHAISHRGQALAQLASILPNFIETRP